MKLSLSVVYSKLPEDVKTAEELTQFLIGEAMQRKYPQGMPRTESRLYAKVQNQFFAAEGVDTIEVDKPTLLMIKEALDGSNFPANQSAWKWALLEHLEAEEKKGDGI